MRILIIRLGAMGDIIHGLPVAALLKTRMPQCHISWLVEPAGIELLRSNPAVDRVIVFPKKKLIRSLKSPTQWGVAVQELKKIMSDLREPAFDAAIDLQGLFKSAIFSVASGAKLRFGFKGTREGAEYLLTHSLGVGDYFGAERHVVELNLRLADYFVDVVQGKRTASDIEGGTESGSLRTYINDGVKFPLPIPPAETVEKIEGWIGTGFGSAPSVAPPLVAFIPGTTWSSKIWPEKKWVELAVKLGEKQACRLILLGGPGEIAVNARIKEQILALAGNYPILDLTGKTTFPDLIALFNKVSLVVGADTGPLHLAAAVGTAPVLGVFGSTPPRRNGPYGALSRSVNLNLSCQPCFSKVCPLGTNACLEDLSAELVLSELQGLAAANKG